MEAANLAAFLKFGKAKNQKKIVIFAKKIMGGHEIGEGEAGAKLRGKSTAPRPGPKTATDQKAPWYG